MISKRIDEAEAPARGAQVTKAGRQSVKRRVGAEICAATSGRTKSEDHLLMEQVVERSNLRRAYQRVVQNKGAPGVDDLTVAEFKDWLKVHWPSVRQALLEGRYLPRPVRRVDIAKPSGGVRTLGVPTVIDRLIQQALHQVLQPLFEPTFSDASYGFRPGRGAQQAVRRAQAYIREGKRWVVDLDLEKFFDRVNHDVLMARVARQVCDARVLKLIRRFLEAGMMQEGLVEPRREGTPQGGPLSPLLSNILLTDLDRELERRNLAFCRYADDCNIYVSSRVAGERVMRGIRVFLEEILHLRINAAKSAVARPWGRKFLGFSVTVQRETRLRIAPESVRRLTQRVRELLRNGRGRSLSHTIETLNPLLRGWIQYFQLTQSKGILEELDGWMRRRLRCLLWRQWRRPRTRQRKLRALGLDTERAWRGAMNGRGPWWNAGAQHMNLALPAAYFTRLGLVSLLREQQRLQCVR
jgi:RNA-directed DNA polymerase